MVTYTAEWEYDVFMCFRGDDTRCGFISHLRAALYDKKIKAFIDDMLDKTESIDELLSVVQRSAVSVVIFSEKFADSTWCLDEVATIARIMEDSGRPVLPVFYKVDPFDVWDKSGSYAATIDKVLEASPEAGKKEAWMDALKKVATRAGLTTEAIKMESALVKAVVDAVMETLIDMSPRVISSKLVGMGSRVSEVEELIAMDEEVTGTRIIGLWGMGGSGKTTLAETCYQMQTSTKRGPFNKRHIIRNIGDKCELIGIDGLILELYSELLSEPKLTRESLNNGFRRRRLADLRVLLLLDDVGSLWQLDQLLLESILCNEVARLFAPGSIIIVTARDKKAIGLGQAVKVHPVKCLQDDESLRAFSLFAFGHSTPPDEWMDLSSNALSYCNGNPLGLRVLGGILNGEDRRYWQSFLKTLTLGRTGVPEIHEILRKSYDKLNDRQQPLFLDVACFLHGMLRSRLIYYTKASGNDAYSDVQDLINKSLLVCVDGKHGEMIEVHGLLKDMAWQIVNKEPELRRRSRLENPEDIAKLLLTLKGTDRATEAINLNLSKAKDMNLEANTFEGMSSLKWLGFCWPHVRLGRRKLHIPGGKIDFPAELRGLQWDNYPLRSLPSGFSPENLRILALRDSSIVKCWEGEGESQAAKLVNLVELDLYGCQYLTVVPDLSMSKHLEVLILHGCESLVEIPLFIGYLNKLVLLNVEDCSNLERIPFKLNSKHLKYLWMSKCWKVTHCPEINSTELMVLDLDRTPINAAPPASIYNKMKQGGILSLYCPQITSYPQIPAWLESFGLSNTSITEIEFPDQHHSSTVAEFDSCSDWEPFLLRKKDRRPFGRLQLVDNSQLERLPVNIWKMVSREFFVEGSPLIETLPEIPEPADMEGFTRLSVTHCNLLKHVPSTINNLKSVQELNFSATAIETLPSCIQELGELLKLELSNCTKLTFIPDILHKLGKLSILIVMGSKRLTSLPRLPPSLKLLSARSCKSLRSLPSDIGRLRCPEMWFDCCSQLDRVSLDEMVSNFPQQVMPLHSQGTRLYPGSELPGWFGYQSQEGTHSVTVSLPAESAQMKGIAFGVVTTSQRRRVTQRMVCSCFIINDYIDGSRHGSSSSRHIIHVKTWSSSLLVGFDDDSSDHVHLWFGDDPAQQRWTNNENQEEENEEEEWHVKYAGASVLLRFYSPENELIIKRCGVSLLY